MRLARPSVLVFAASLLGTTAFGQTFVVDDDGGPGVDFQSIAVALEQVPADSVLIVRSGNYAGFNTDKPATVAAARGALVEIDGQVIVRDIPAGDVFVLQGLHIESTLIAETIQLKDSEGTIFVEDCVVQITQGLPALGALHAISVIDVADAVLIHSQAIGGGGSVDNPVGGSGLYARNSNVHGFECSLTGGQGVSLIGDGGLGGTGVSVVSSFVFLTDTLVHGGEGGEPGTAFGCIFESVGGTGGTGITLGSGFSLPPPLAVLVATTVEAGVGGTSTQAGCSPGQPGEPMQVVTGSIQIETADPASFRIEDPIGPFARARLVFEGAPGDLVGYFFGLEPNVMYQPGYPGTLIHGFPYPVVIVGTIDSSGTLAVPLARFPGPRAFIQAVHFTTQGPRASSPAVIVKRSNDGHYLNVNGRQGF